jgi:hypothetical protein
MSEQSINVNSSIFLGRGFLFKKFYTLSITFLACLLSACLPVGENEINTELFKNKDDMKMRAAELEPGMTKKAVFERLNISPEKFSRMSTQEVQMSIYGNSQVQGTPEQLEQFKQRMLAYEGFSLPYREIKSSGSLGFGTMKINKNGYDLKLVLIFEKNRLLRASVDGNQEVNEDENAYLWNAVLKKSVGIGF